MNNYSTEYLRKDNINLEDIIKLGISQELKAQDIIFRLLLLSHYNITEPQRNKLNQLLNRRHPNKFTKWLRDMQFKHKIY